MRNTVIPPRRTTRESAAKSDTGTSSATDVRVLVADDQQLFRAAVRDIVAATPGFTIVGEAASGEEAILSVEAIRPELVLMDVRMPGIGGCRATKILVDHHPEVVVWLVTAEAATALPGIAGSCGAAGVADKRALTPRVLREFWEGRGRQDVPAHAL
jgi:two-component system, NarL family, invasion response regulator UvrY